MPKYVIERELPGARKLSAQELQDISQKSCEGVQKMDSELQWNKSYVMGDKIYCEYIAANKDVVIEHAKKGCFSAFRISEIRPLIDRIST
jgi:hypothetical protein